MTKNCDTIFSRAFCYVPGRRRRRRSRFEDDDIVNGGEPPKDTALVARAKEEKFLLRVVSRKTSSTISPRGRHQSFDVIQTTRTTVAEESRRPRWRFRRTLLRVKTRRAVVERKKRRTTETDRHFDRRERDVPLQTAHV